MLQTGDFRAPFRVPFKGIYKGFRVLGFRAQTGDPRKTTSICAFLGGNLGNFHNFLEVPIHK